jgi:recombination protein RecA
MSLKEIEKVYGECFTSGQSIIDRPRMIIPVSPRLDIALGGGIPEGSWFILTGPNKCGKSSLALTVASTCQQEKYGSRHIYYANVEGRLKQRDVLGIDGLNIDKFTVIESRVGNILTATKYLSIIERIVHENPGCVIVVDSFSSLVTESEYTSGMDEMQRADGPKLIAKFCRKLANVVQVNNTLILGITQLMSNPSGYGKAWKEKSGNSLAYQADSKLWCNKFNIITDSNGKPMHQEIEWQVITSALGPPGQKCESILTFGHGINKALEVVRLAVDLNIIEKKSSWYQLSDGTKLQGEEKVLKYVQKNNLYEELDGEIKKIFQ